MQTPKTFDIRIRRKIPVISTILYGLLIFFGFYLLLFYLFLLPSRHASDEMKVAYYILAVPDFVKTSGFISFIGFLLTSPLYFALRLRKIASLTFHQDTISIKGNKIDIEIPKQTLSKFYCNDLKTFDDKPKEEMQVQIIQNGGKTTTFRLLHYTQAEAFIDELAMFEKVDFAFYDRGLIEDDDED